MKDAVYIQKNLLSNYHPIGNYLISPYSIEIALNMLRDGANGESKEQIDKVIGTRDIPVFDVKERISVTNGAFIKNEVKDLVNDSYYEKYVWNAINFCKFNLRKDYYAYIENKEKEDKKYCYLTFEGGPTENTKHILNILNEKKVNASFLVTGDKDLDQLINIRNNGNTIGLLSYNSDYGSIYNDEKTYINGMDVLNNQVSYIIGTYPKFMRFYGGSYNVESSLFERLKIYIQGKDMAYLDWNVDSGDYENITKEEIINNVINGINNKNIVCIRFHDDIYNQNTVYALPEIIDILKEKGYNIKAWDQYSHTFHFK